MKNNCEHNIEDSEFYITAKYGDDVIFGYSYDMDDYDKVLSRMDSFIEEIATFIS